MRAKFWAVFLCIALTVAACAPAPVATPQQDAISTMVASTLQALTAAAPTTAPTETPPAGTAVSFQNVSFVIPAGVALGANGESVPAVTEENGDPWDVAPAHVRFTFFGYNNQLAKFPVMEISIFPAQEYAAVSNGAAISLPKLQSILAAPGASIDPQNLPLVPYFNAAQMFAAQIKVMHFASGNGVRMITQYGQAVGPAANNETFYHFQGLTSDGKYYVIAILPVGAPYLLDSDSQTNPDNPNAGLPQGGVPFPGYSSLDPRDYETYFQAIVDKMNATDPNAFIPTLPMLDALVQSITVAP
jgi:hypothetical protein